ncbi:ClpX C4-type zinc finger protein [Gymnodinialimonas sp. 2305UL16-5]|uniref:ClpX C4-type zinc finger protein n=1 Tax=Gymnodinialimonas mytili TaxID=3126503 RepID=UPI0030AAC412
MLSCSFCGKPADQTGALLAGPEVNICDTCIAVGVRTLETRDALEEAPVTENELHVADDELLLSQMAATSELVERQSERLQAQVGEGRRRGIGWRAIGVSLGVSQELAEARFGS